MTIAPFPHQYTVTYDRGQLHADPRLPIRAGAPPQFDGSDDVWSPEELLVGATVLCLETTFAALARRAGVTVHGWRATGTGILDRSTGGPVFTGIRIAVDVVTAPGDEDRVADLLRKAERHCIVSKALRAPVEVTPTIQALSSIPVAS
jgi:organic hydroperoxide reductase OsmC/OhrA